MAITVQIVGLKEVQAKFKNLPAQLQAIVRGEVEDGCKFFVRNAQKDAPVDFGTLRQGISYAFVIADKTRTTFQLVSNAKYSAYLEFGTITFAKFGVARATAESQQPTLPAYAITFKGRGIRRTGGIYPQPFFFKQLPATKLFIEKKLAAVKL